MAAGDSSFVKGKSCSKIHIFWTEMFMVCDIPNGDLPWVPPSVTKITLRRCSIYEIFTCIWLKGIVYICKYSIHGAYAAIHWIYPPPRIPVINEGLVRAFPTKNLGADDEPTCVGGRESGNSKLLKAFSGLTDLSMNQGVTSLAGTNRSICFREVVLFHLILPCCKDLRRDLGKKNKNMFSQLVI